jgi:hypothetical protein
MEVTIMNDRDRIPVEMRWRLASRLVTFLPLAFDRACREAGEPGCEEMIYSVVQEAARESIPLVASFRLPKQNAAEIAQTLCVVSETFFGPGSGQRMVEGSGDQAVVRLTGCPIMANAAMTGIDPEDAIRLCRIFNASVVAELNSGYRYRISRALCQNNPFCEIIIEKIE